jgi:hypothetical protein
MRVPNYETIIDYRLNSIPCKIGVISHGGQKPYPGSPFGCDSDLDYYGFFESDWEILDIRERCAPWLSIKLTNKDKEEIETIIYKYYSNITYDEY